MYHGILKPGWVITASDDITHNCAGTQGMAKYGSAELDSELPE